VRDPERLCCGDELARVPEGDRGGEREYVDEEYQRADPDRSPIRRTDVASAWPWGRQGMPPIARARLSAS
jgi:hypothetical protein